MGAGISTLPPGTPSASTTEYPNRSMDPFYRLFLVPGMNHCVGGQGAGVFGQYGSHNNVVNASTHNVLLAMVDWVEKGVAPEVVFRTGLDASQREHYRYPQRSIWNGTVFRCQA